MVTSNKWKVVRFVNYSLLSYYIQNLTSAFQISIILKMSVALITKHSVRTLKSLVAGYEIIAGTL